MKSSIVLLGGALCLVQAGYHIQYSDQILLPRAVGKARQASKRLALQPAIQKKKLGGGPLKEETGSDKEEDSSHIVQKKEREWAKAGRKRPVSAGFYSGAPESGYTKTDGVKHRGELSFEEIHDGRHGVAVHQTEVKAKARGPSNGGVDFKAWATGPYTKASINVKPGGMTTLYKSTDSSETAQQIPGSNRKQSFYFDNGGQEHVQLTANNDRDSDHHPERNAIAVTAKTTPFSRSPSPA